ncbi:unnamed protein product [Phytophthora lilii]|uniref:Unnamed protein product n=1 Tax=Phytophthora lilii TaxID=2077276 RepID=A0A9W6X6B1_9STRA|nr:unnamed protein product [Phytophthora lilii]
MAGTRSRSLHCNGKQINAAAIHLESRLLQSARGPYSRLVSDSLPKRPQSAKPVLQTYYDSIDAHKVTSEKRAAMRDGKQSSAHPVKKKKKRRSVDRASGRLTPSKSAPVLPNETDRSQHSPTCKKINIIVNMRSLQLAEEDESPDEAAPPPRQAWGD